MNNERLRAVLEEAYALASSLPEGIQTAAFAKAFDVLREQHGVGEKPRRRAKQAPSRRSSGAGNSASRSRRVGPKLALCQLLNGGYFATSRSLPEIQAHLKDSHGYDYGSNELSISLLRLTRDGRLVRERNLAGQYEYWEPGRGSRQAPRAEKPRHLDSHARLLTDGKGAMK